MSTSLVEPVFQGSTDILVPSVVPETGRPYMGERAGFDIDFDLESGV